MHKAHKAQVAPVGVLELLEVQTTIGLAPQCGMPAPASVKGKFAT